MYRCNFQEGSYELAMLLKNGYSVYLLNDSGQKTYYIENPLEQFNLGLENLKLALNLDHTDLVKVEIPTSRMGLWAYKLLLSSK